MITAASNSRIKRLVQLNQKSKLRRTEDVFLAEGVKMFLEAPREQLQEVYVSESFLEKCSCSKQGVPEKSLSSGNRPVSGVLGI